MSSVRRSRTLRWTAPVVVGLSISATALVPTLSAGASPNLPPLTPTQLIEKVHSANVSALSGTLRLTSKLGLPDLGSIAGPVGDSPALQLLSGSHDARIWLDGPDRQRVALLDTLAETDVIHNGQDVWVWQSAGAKVSHQVLPAHAGGAAQPETADATPEAGTTPADVAKQLLDNLDPTTVVGVASPDDVAQRHVYELTLSPRDASSTVDHVGIAVDSASGLPLRIQVVARRASSAALSLGFTSLSLHTPSASTFRFTPPPGSHVVTGSPLGALGPQTRHFDGRMGAPGNAGLHHRHALVGPDGVPAPVPAPPGMAGVGSAPAADQPVTVGDGWTTVALFKAGALPAQANGILRLATAVPGGRLLHTALVNVLVLDDGRIAVGAVTPAALQAAAASAH